MFRDWLLGSSTTVWNHTIEVSSNKKERVDHVHV
jgi:hypothetical protein